MQHADARRTRHHTVELLRGKEYEELIFITPHLTLAEIKDAMEKATAGMQFVTGSPTSRVR